MNDSFYPSLPPCPKRILFVCTGNSCRSVFAEGVLKSMLAKEGLDIHVYSAGTAASPHREASSYTLSILNQRGIDLSTHRTREISCETLEQADIVFVMERNHFQAVLKMCPHIKKRVFMLSDFYSDREMLGPDIPDPMGRDHFFHENVNEIIQLCCERILKKLKEEAAPLYSR